MKHDIFISYYNDSMGILFASHLADSLDKMGYSVYFNGKMAPEKTFESFFPDRLNDAIESCKDFILIITEKAESDLSKKDNNSWVKMEIMTALEKGKNIIPVYFPEHYTIDFSEEICFLSMLNSVSFPDGYYNEPLQRLVSCLQSVPVNIVPKDDSQNQDTQKAYTFISYSSKNQADADAMRDVLQKNGIQTWMAPGDIPPGSKYAQVINGAVKNCTCFILMLSNDSQNSVWVAKEVERAVCYQKPIIPVMLEDVVLNDEFVFYISTDQIVAVKKIDEESDAVKRIIGSVTAMMQRS